MEFKRGSSGTVEIMGAVANSFVVSVESEEHSGSSLEIFNTMSSPFFFHILTPTLQVNIWTVEEDSPRMKSLLESVTSIRVFTCLFVHSFMQPDEESANQSKHRGCLFNTLRVF